MTSPRIAEAPGAAGVRYLADQMFSRASGARLREGNCVRLLKDAVQNYPAWLDAIRAARRTIHVEMYIVHDDEQGRLFSQALVEKARQGVRVRLLYDWVGGLSTSRGFWKTLRAGGVDVRCYNRLRFDSPIGWVSRDHRKMIAVDRTVGFVTGLCIGDAWVGNPGRGIEPWRDTGVEVSGPAVDDIEDAFAEAWAATGEPLPDEPDVDVPVRRDTLPAGTVNDVAMRIVATVPNTGGLFRVDQLVAALARRSLWLTDAYFAGTAPYVQALQAAARDGVDVRLLVPGGSDIPPFMLLSRAGYRPLLEAGVRVFEWNGPMMHAKTAVADGRWARVGSTNLNLSSWIGNRELDAIVENEAFASQMEAMFVDDLARSTEVVLNLRNRVRASAPRPRRPMRIRGSGSGNRAVAGAIRIGRRVTAAVVNRRVLEPVEAHIALLAAGVLTGLALVAYSFPRVIATPLAIFTAWAAAALLYRGVTLLRERRREARSIPRPDTTEIRSSARR